MDNLADDPSFIDAIVHEVKSQGPFDQFRKECLADVDTKPAYQNLRQRVEASVSKFLSQQKWTDNILHKKQVREKLRKHIIDSGFLETGVDRIVDQVVNPKISTVFHPKVEEIVYNYLGIEKPTPLINGSGLEVQTDFLPEDLEAVSPDSDKKSSSTSSDIQNAIEHNANEELNESRENADDFESPAFEPLETRPPSQAKHESNDSHASAISGLTSQESVESEHMDSIQEPSVQAVDIGENIDENDKEINGRDEEALNVDEKISHQVSASPEIAQNDSQLSQVSSNSRLSIITSSEGVIQQQGQQQMPLPNPRLDITEEAQMPKFNENSNEEEGEIPDSNEDEPVASDGNGPQKSNFDLGKETYEFKGTERNRFLDVEVGKSLRDMVASEEHDSLKNGGDPKGEAHNISDDHPKDISSPLASVKFEENSSQSERSLRICEDSTIEQRALDTSSHLDNCDSVKTPLNDEHSTQSAPDVEKMDSSQVEVVSLAAVQQHVEKEKKPVDRHRNRDRDNDRERKHSSSHRHRSSSSRDRRSHSSSKHSGSGSSRKSDHRDRKSENGNSNSNSGGSKRTQDKKKDEDDDHYSSHDQPTKKRRSTDRDSNDGADIGKPSRPSGESGATSGETGNDTTKNSDKRSSGQQHNQAKLNESLESSFEGFDEDQLQCESKQSPRKINKSSKAPTKSTEKGKKDCSFKGPKKVKKHLDKSPKDADRKNAVLTMDVFTFSFDKPAKLGNNGEFCNEDAPSTPALVSGIPTDTKDMVLREEEHILPTSDSIDQLEEGVIVLEPIEIERVIRANEELLASQEVTSSIDDETLQITQQNFPATDPDDLVTLAIQPVVVDQMLTKGDNMDLELLIGEKRLCGDETTLEKIQLGLDVMKNKIRKPKIASNFNEARRLMKVRKQMEREEKKKREQAMVLAKKLITENGNASEEDQGIELEFVCDSNRTSSGPTISSPIRQKAKLNKSFEEDELMYFPEEDEVFPHNQAYLAYLKQKTSSVSFAEDFKIEHFKIKLYTLENMTRNSDQEKDDVDEVLAVVLTDSSNSAPDQKLSTVDVDNVQSGEPSVELDMELPKLLKMRATSIDSEHEIEPERKGTEPAIVSSQKAGKRKSSRSPPVTNDDDTKVDYDELIETKRVMVKSSSAEGTSPKDVKIANTTGPINGSILNLRAGKTKRLGLSKPRGSIINNNSTAILTVDISDVKTTSAGKQSPTAFNNNNGTIKAQRYSSDDLYKPRSLNGLRTRTRTRANEGVRAEVGM